MGLIKTTVNVPRISQKNENSKITLGSELRYMIRGLKVDLFGTRLTKYLLLENLSFQESLLPHVIIKDAFTAHY